MYAGKLIYIFIFLSLSLLHVIEAATESEQTLSQPQLQPPFQPRSQSQLELLSEPQPDPEAELEPEPEPEPGLELQSQSQSQPQLLTQPESQLQSEPQQQPQPQSQPESQPEPEQQQPPQPQPQPESQPEPGLQQEPQPQPQPEPEPEPQQQSQPQPQPQVQPEPQQQLQPSEINYQFDSNTCGQLKGILSDQALTHLIEGISTALGGRGCQSKLDPKLLPATNQRIKGMIMEVGSMHLDLAQLNQATSTQISCGQTTVDGEVVTFSMVLNQEMPEIKLQSRWRHYPRLQVNDIPLEGFRSSRNGGGDRSSKCQEFRVENGVFYLKLLSLRTTQKFQVYLNKTVFEKQQSSSLVGTQVRMTNYQVNELYLDHEMINLRTIESIDSETLVVPSITVQILHEQNNHYRRNNWLLEMYANWLKHEYRHQLGLLLDTPLIHSLNLCLINKNDLIA